MNSHNIIEVIQKNFHLHEIQRLIFAGGLLFLQGIPYEYALLILLLFLSFFIDCITGYRKAKIFKVDKSSVFRNGVSNKVVAFGIVIFMGLSLDRVLQVIPFLDDTFGLTIIITGILIFGEWKSIIENCKDIGIKIPPIIVQLFNIRNNKFFNKIKPILGQEDIYNFDEDINRLKMLNIKTTPPDYRMMYDYTIDSFNKTLSALFLGNYYDKEGFALNCEILLKGTRDTVLDNIRLTSIHEVDKARFMRGYDRQNNKIKEYITKTYQCPDIELKGFINGVYQYIIRSLYAGIADVLQKSKYDTLELTAEEIAIFNKK